MALIDTLTNYVLSADERVHKRLSLYIRINDNDAMSVTKMHRCSPGDAIVLLHNSFAHARIFWASDPYKSESP